MFQAAWLHHETFPEVVKEAWNGDVTWTQGKNIFQDKAREWNKRVFRNIFRRKEKLIRRLNGIDKTLQTRPSNSLYCLQGQLWKELNDTLRQEEIIWFQKSRCNWLNLGDRNTSFFHATTIIRRKKNKILSLKNEEGVWIDDQNDLKKMTVDFYKSLFAEDKPVRPFLNCPVTFPTLDLHDIQDLERTLTNEEIKEAAFSMGPFKAPGADGLHAIFFQSQWDIIGNSVCSFIQKAFVHPEIIKEVNQTILVLIPKIDHPETLKDMRPISLCNVIYKILTKIIANRIKTYLPKLISPNQSSFVPGRHSSDNIIVAQEIIHSMKCKKGTKGFMAIKIDLEKAFDRINWDFIKNTLFEIGLSFWFINIIMCCVHSGDMKIAWNGDRTDAFSPSRGVRQGDPLSPYLFVICMEKLGHCIENEIANGRWKPIKLNKNGPALSHLFFADDIILLAEASLDQVNCINKCLNLFCNASGQKVNNNKTKVFFSKNIHHSRSSQLSNELGFNLTSDLGKYLGVPLHHNRVSRDMYHFILDKVNSRLSNWKTNIINFTGRTILVNSVINAMPSYVMQTTKLPLSICEDVEQLARNFVWGHKNNIKKIHLLSWKHLCSEKERGGLGFRHLKDMNRAFMSKNAWGLITHRNSLWVRVLRSKYGCGDDVIPKIHNRASSSNVWKGICDAWDSVQEGLIWRVGKGTTVSFWKDRWVPGCDPLENYLCSSLSNHERNRLVSDFAINGSSWDFQKFNHLLPQDIVDRIRCIQPPNFDHDEDEIAWKFTPDGSFSVKSAYDQLAISDVAAPTNRIWKHIWKWPGPPKIRSFLWLVTHDRIPTNFLLASRNVIPSYRCPFSCRNDETVLHCLRDCIHAKELWSMLIKPIHWHTFFSLDLNSWILHNLSFDYGIGVVQGMEWRYIFGFAVWSIWKNRCSQVFGNGSKRVNDLLRQCLFHVQEFKELATHSNSGLNKQKTIINIGWEFPPLGWLKFNVDGSVKEQGRATCGGVLRDATGRWINGFACNLGYCTITHAEINGILNALKIAANMKLNYVIIESDSSSAIQMILKGVACTHSAATTVREIKRLIQTSNWIIRIFHTHRQANALADYLATHAHSLPPGVHIFTEPLHGCRDLLVRDLSGVVFPRVVPV